MTFEYLSCLSHHIAELLEDSDRISFISESLVPTLNFRIMIRMNKAHTY